MLCDVILKSDSSITTKTVEEVLETMPSIAVIPVATGILRADLVTMRQGEDKLFRTFAAKVRGKAETCGLKVEVECECKKVVEADYVQTR
jgi:hypothetical protein